MSEENQETGKYEYGYDCIRDGMQAMKIIHKTVYEMGGTVLSNFVIKESNCGDQDGVKGLSITAELFFSPRRLHEYIAQHPLPEGDNG